MSRPTIPVILVTLALVNLTLKHQQVAHGQEQLNSGIFAQVQPFDDAAHLPEDRIRRRARAQSDYSHSFGYVERLDTLAQARLTSQEPTEFYGYTRQGLGTHGIEFRANAPQTITDRPRDAANDFQYNLESMAASGFDVGRRTVVMIPGYLNRNQAEWALSAKDFWVQLHGEQEGGVNVLVVSWPASQTGYSQAVADTVFVARQVTIFLHYLAQLGGTSLRDHNFLSRIHLVGHSLGAHIAGFVGQDLGGRVGRITGLDPAGPSFDRHALDQRLNRDQAQLVEILHTNAGQMRYVNAFAGAFLDKFITWLTGLRPDESGSWLGINQQLGHVDYYANNGRTQEGCSRDVLHSCDHKRATEIYVDLLRREVELRRTGGRENVSQASRDDRRLWAFRADNYFEFESGAQFDRLCPEMMQVEAHLSPAQVATNYAKCALPLMDFWTPLGELIRELRDKFNVNFDPHVRADRQPRYYFRTQMNSRTNLPERPELLGDPYLLKVYLDPSSTAWNPERCSLGANLYWPANGEQVQLELSDLRAGQSILAMPFAHPSGHRAHADLNELLLRLRHLETIQQLEQVALSVRQLFPAQLDLSVMLSDRRIGVPDCRVGVKSVEVHPVRAFGPSNIGVTSGGGGPQIQGSLVSTSDFANQLQTSTQFRWISNKSQAPNKLSVAFNRLLLQHER